MTTAQKLRHVVLSNPLLRGIEYGMLRDFEDEIIRLTDATRVFAPSRSLPAFIGDRLAHGTRYSEARKWVPKKSYSLEADILWVILMGPENFTLDLFKNWDRHAGLKILYMFDTFDGQIPSVRRVIRSSNWDFVATAFHGAKPLLEEATNRPWHLVRQGVNLRRFPPATKEKRVIDFCAYGRRLEKVHHVVKKYCADTTKYYDYTTASGIQSNLDARDHYAQYAWHLGHTVFNFCWPVECTHPHRVSNYSPITCRWFEAAASGNAIIGCKPLEPGFDRLFGDDAIIEVDPDGDDLPALLNEVCLQKDLYLERAIERREKLSTNWTWESRIKQIAGTIGFGLIEQEQSCAVAL